MPVIDLTTSAVYLGDNLPYLEALPPNSLDLVCTDPPYGLALLGKNWDKALPPPLTWQLCYRALKPGGSLLAMATARLDLLWRLSRDIEAAGFDLTQPAMVWAYRSGMPKGLDLSKAADEAAGEEREVIGPRRLANGREHSYNIGFGEGEGYKSSAAESLVTAPSSDLACELAGYYTKGKLKPAVEFIAWAQKPLSEPTVLANVVKWGVGGLNCLACMIPHPAGQKLVKPRATANNSSAGLLEGLNSSWVGHNELGRFPANLLVTDSALGPDLSYYFDVDAWAADNNLPPSAAVNALSGVLDVPKPDELDRNFGCITGPNRHLTVKPLALFAFLIQLLAPPTGLVLDPFCGSGTCPVAAVLTGRTGIGIELEAASHQTASERLHSALNPPPSPEEAAGQQTLF